MTVTPNTENECPFCLIAFGRAPAEIVERWDDAIAIVPLNPVTSGHVLVIPLQHVTDALAVTEVSAATMRRTVELADGPCNLITSVGAEATQTVRHLHLHIVPRRPGDGLLLPWSPRPARGELTELLAAAAHDGWMASKREQGITSRLAEWGEEFMVPYADLSEKAKDIDRGAVTSVLDAIDRAGLTVAGANP